MEPLSAYPPTPQDRLMLDIQKFAVRRNFPLSVRETMVLTTWETQLRGAVEAMAVELSASVLTDSVLRTVEAKVEIEVYASWWDHTKAVIWPSLWARLGRPAEMLRLIRPVRVDLTRNVLFPDMAAKYPSGMGRQVSIDTHDYEVGDTIYRRPW